MQSSQSYGRGSDQSPVGILRLSFELPESLPYVTHLRRTACCFMESLRILGEDKDDLELLIGELATNAARHARGGYHVELEFFQSQALITVVDTGQGFSPDALPLPGTYRPDDLSDDGSERIGGFGLPLVFSIADEVDIQPNATQGMTVRARKRLRSDV